MNELKIIIKAVTTDAQKNMQAVKKELQEISKGSKSTSEKFSTAMKGIAKSVAIVVTAITAAVAAITALGKSTIEYQKQAAQLNAAFAAAGKSAEEAATVYKGFFRFLGESDTAVEASNLLIKLTQDEKNLAEWTKILQGVYATFPDSLPIEALVESANETARVGQVTGNLADALNWAGASEEAFNAQLAQTNSLNEREALIRNTLNGLYGRAAEIYEQNNSALLEYNESQARLQQASASLGATITPLLTYLNNLAATVMTVLKPAFEKVLPYIAGFVLWLTEAISRAAIFSSVMSGANETVQNTGNSISNSFSGANDALEETKEQIDAIKKATMGFDELNVVPSNSASSSSGSAVGGAAGIEGFDGLTSVAGSLDEFKKKTEEVRDSVKAWMDEWGWTLELIAGILAALSIRGLLLQFGEAIGLGEAFAKALSFTGITAGITAFAGWLKTVIELLIEGNSITAILGASFPKLAAVVTKVGGAFSSAAKAVAAFVGGLSGGTIAAIAAAIVALASAVYFLYENWSAVVDKVKEFAASNLGPIIDEFKESFTALWEAIKSLGAAFVNLGAAIFNALPPTIQNTLIAIGSAIRDVVVAIAEWFASIDWLEAIGTAFEWLGGIVVGIVGGAIAGAIQALLNLIESAVQIITGAVQIISGILGAFANLIVGIFTGDFSKCLESCELIWEGIKNVFKGAIDAIIGTVWGFIEGIIDFFVHMWDVLVGHSIVPDMIMAIIEWFVYLPVRVFELVAGFVKGVIDFFADLAVTLGKWAVVVWDAIKAPFVVVGSWFKDIFTSAANGIKSAFSGLSSFFSGIWNSIKKIFSNVGATIGKAITNTVTVAINGILSAAVTIINGFIKAINLAISVINYIPGVEISKIKELKVPKLAKGGIVDRATLAMIGERGREAVVPLENNTEWIDKLVDKLAARNNTPSKIVLMLDGKELGWANINSINNITRQTGTLQLQLA